MKTRFFHSSSQFAFRFLSRFLSDDQGQATVEYILILSVTVIVAVGVMKKFIVPAFAKMQAALSNNIDKQLFGANMHYYRIRR